MQTIRRADQVEFEVHSNEINFGALQTSIGKREAATLLNALREGRLTAFPDDYRSDTFELSNDRFSLAGVRLADLFPDRKLEMVDAADANLCRTDLSNFTLRRCNFVRSRLKATNWSSVVVSDSDFSWADCRWSRWANAKLTDLSLIGARLAGADLTGCNFSGCDLTNADLRGIVGVRANFSRSNLTGCDFSGSNLVDAEFAHSEFNAATNFSYSVLSIPKFHPVKFKEANFFGCMIQRNDGTRQKPRDWPEIPPSNRVRTRVSLFWIWLLRECFPLRSTLAAVGAV